MVSAREFREYADECMRSAKTVRSDKELKPLLRMRRRGLRPPTYWNGRSKRTAPARSARSGLQMTLDSCDGLDASVVGSLIQNESWVTPESARGLVSLTDG
jgi:hypothetical protein